MVMLGGLVGTASTGSILVGPSNGMRVLGQLPQATHDAAAVLLGHDVYLFGGGSSVSTPNVVRVNLSSGKSAKAPPLGEPLSDLGAVAIGGKAYLVGGYTGTQFASAILRYLPGGGTQTVARLPQGTRYAGVTAVGGTIYVAGGLTPSGTSRDVYAVKPGGKPRVVARLPAPEDHGGLAAIDGTLFYVVGRLVIAIDPQTGGVKIAARLPASLSDPSVAAVGHSLVVAGGGTNGIWALTPAG
jgi:hypothetical protein